MNPNLEKTTKDLAFLHLMPETLKEVNKYVEQCYKDGVADELDRKLEDTEIPDNTLVKIGVDYAVEQFEEIESWSDFKEKLLELQRLQLNYTDPMGLKDAQGNLMTLF